MTGIQRIDDDHAAAALADLLNGHTRTRPVVVVTVPANRDEPWIDVTTLTREVGDLATVYLMATGRHTWNFSDRMPEGTQVYGGAGRVYPVGHAWTTNLAHSPLRFAFNADDGLRATQALLSDAFRMAGAAGLLAAPAAPRTRPVTGRVRHLVASRALVDVGAAMPATIAAELTVEGVPLERTLTQDQTVSGVLDPVTNRIDITASLRPASEALADYAVGDVVLTKVAMVRNGKADLVLYPATGPGRAAVSAPVLRDDVTSNPADDLRTLMTVGEVIPARVVETTPRWVLRLIDVDDDEPVREAPALIEGGPAWLVEESVEVLDLPPVPAPVLPAQAPVPGDPVESLDQVLPVETVAPVAPVETVRQVEPEQDDTPQPPRPRRPTPAMFDPNRRSVPAPEPVVPEPVVPETEVEAPVAEPSAEEPAAEQPVVTPPTETTRSLLLTIDGLKAAERHHGEERDDLRSQVQGLTDERTQLRFLLEQAERRANKAEHDLKSARSRLRKAGTGSRRSDPREEPVFADAETGFRHLVLSRWATRTSPGEQSSRPLGSYDLGPRFLDSLARLEGISEHKVADVVVEIVTGVAAAAPGREVHRLRTGPGGSDPVRSRPDGATCWRASLQVNTPSARRIHYWTRHDGTVELAQVGTHDDFNA